LADVVLGFDTLDEYVANRVFMGATVGRVANRIAGAAFTLDGRAYPLAASDPPHHLHGGARGWDKRLWDADAAETPRGPSVTLRRVSPDGEEGYPGTVTATVVYTWTHDGALEVAMRATTDRPTPLAMAHHSYWNLAGAGTILDHTLQLHAARYTPGDPVVPDGRVLPVAGTALDFTAGKPIGRDLARGGARPIGYDHSFVVEGEPTALREAAQLADPASGRVMTLVANQPGVQLYSGNFLDGSTAGKGFRHVQHAALCLETQAFPNAVNVPAWRDQAVLRPGEEYRHVMLHRFAAG